MKITLLGDSIRIQYQDRVQQLLGDGFEIFAPEHNCRFAKFTLRGLFEWRNDMENSRIVHWNNGLWDICDLFGDGPFCTEAEYTETVLRIADLLLARFDRVIFATTTPVSEQNRYNRNEDISRYNDLIVPLLREKGVIINDLHARLRENAACYISDDTIHLNEKGIEICAQAVADVIAKAASELPHESMPATAVAPVEAQGAPVEFAKQ